MRSATAAAQSALQAQSGQDPFVVLKLVLGTQVYWFADRDLTQDGLTLQGRVQDHGRMTDSVKVDRSGRCVGTVSVIDFTLLDEDLFLLAKHNAYDFQGATAVVYHWFVGHTQADMLLILNGRLEKAPEWIEDDRTLKVTVETPRRINPIPFAPTEADALDVDLALLGHTWPMCFGTPSDVPATQVKAAPRGTLTQDMTQDGQIVDQTVGGIAHVAVDVPGSTFLIDNPNEDFPQGVESLVRVADEYMLGTFSGNTLTVSQRQANHYTGIPVSGTGAIVTVPAGVRAAGQYIIIRDDTSSVSGVDVAEVFAAAATAQYSSLIGVPDTSKAINGFVGYCYKQVGNDCYIWNGDSTVVIRNSVADVNRYPNLAAAGALWVHKAGSPVVVASVHPVWMANSIPSTSVVRVRAWRQVTSDDRSGLSQRRLVVVPSSLYTVDLSDSAYLDATTITMDESLQDRESGWENDLYVTVESTVGSNTSDAIKYLIDHQSEGKLTSDATSFAIAHSALSKYPSNFAVQEQADVLDVCGDIAWQARCGIVMNGASVQIKYLSAEPTSGVMNLTDVNVAEGSAELSTTRIEDVITVLTAEWRANYSDQKPQRLLYRTNVARYGKREQKYSFWIYQTRSCVKKSADFWSARLGRIWRKVETQQWGLEGLMADPLDYVGWRLADFYGSFYGLVTDSSMSHPYTAVSATLPIEAGAVVKSTHFWMSDSVDVTPAARDLTGGSSAAEAEIILTPPPEVISVAQPEQQVYHVFANADEVTEPASSDWKTVEVRIVTGEEYQAVQDAQANDHQIAEIDALDPDGHNSTLQSQRQDLVSANADLTAYIQSFIDHPSIVTARNPSSLYMVIGDEGTMIKIPGGEYVVTPANSSGPFIVKVSKRPASPAEGTLYVDFAGTLPGKVQGTQQINVLGDGAGIQIGDLLLCFRDSKGAYFTPGTSVTGTVGTAKVLTTSNDNRAIPVSIWLTTDFDRDPDITTTAVMPSLASPYNVAAGAWGMVTKQTDGFWVLQMLTVQNYVP